MRFPGIVASLRSIPATACLPLFALLCTGISCTAQNDSADQNSPTMTLHVYTNLIQIPVLILGPFLDYAPKIDPKKLTVTVDNGKPFHPVHVRPEGNDPITLAILLDLSDNHNEVWVKLGDAVSKLATQSLHSYDDVAIYSVNCNLVRVAHFAPPDPDVLKAAVTSALATASLENKHHRACGEGVHLFDAIAMTSHEMRHQTGRRVILAISPGDETGSIFTGENVHQFLVNTGVALFGLAPSRDFSYGLGLGMGSRMSDRNLTSTEQPSSADSFHQLSELSGGIVRHTSLETLSKDMATFVKTVRERIIIEFPRPKDATGGSHIIDVKLQKSRAFIRSAGISVPLADPAVLADPTTLHPEDQPPLDPTAPATPVPPQ